MQSERRNSTPILERLIVFLFSIMLLVDSVNGLTMRAAEFSVSAPFKGVLLILVVLYLKRWISVSLVVVTLLLFVFMHLFILGDIASAITSSEILFKFLSIVIFYWFFRRLLQERDYHTVLFVAAIAGIVIVANLMLGVAGFGYAQYDAADQTTIGLRGLFYSGNELSVVYVLIVSLLLMKLVLEERYFWYIAVGLGSTMLSVLLATKVTILSVLLLFISFPFLAVTDRRLLDLRLSRKKFRFAALISILFPVVVFSSVYILLYEINLMDRLLFFYRSADFIDVAMSGRNILAADAWSIFSRDYSTSAMLFGRGYYWDGSLDASKWVEIDPVDILMTYGIIGLCLVYGFFLSIIVRIAANFHNNPFGKYVFLAAVLLMGISFSAGHVVYSGMGGYLLAALLALGTSNSGSLVSTEQPGEMFWETTRQTG